MLAGTNTYVGVPTYDTVTCNNRTLSKDIKTIRLTPHTNERSKIDEEGTTTIIVCRVTPRCSRYVFHVHISNIGKDIINISNGWYRK